MALVGRTSTPESFAVSIASAPAKWCLHLTARPHKILNLVLDQYLLDHASRVSSEYTKKPFVSCALQEIIARQEQPQGEAAFGMSDWGLAHDFKAQRELQRCVCWSVLLERALARRSMLAFLPSGKENLMAADTRHACCLGGCFGRHRG